MKDQIIQANNLYKPAIDNIIKIEKHLSSRNIDNGLFFNNDHHMKIGKEIKSVQYPIPNIICNFGDIKTKIGMDIVTSKDYIGFVKFTINKEQISSFKFDKIKNFKFEIYGSYFCKEVQIGESIENLKDDMTSSRESNVFIKIKVSSIQEIVSIIDKFTQKIKKDFVITSYICDCGHKIEIDADNGQCPICGKDSPHKRKFDKICPACKNKTLVDMYGNGECEYCGWIQCEYELQNPDTLMYPNVTSLNHAKKLAKNGMKIKPTFEDFVESVRLNLEPNFKYKKRQFGSTNFSGYEFYEWNKEEGYQSYKTIEEFAQKVNIDGKYLKDIWDDVYQFELGC